MTHEQIKAMILDILAEADYDLFKNYVVETAEEPEYIEERMGDLIRIAEKHLQSSKS